MRRVPVGLRLAGGFIVAGLVALLAAGFAGLLPSQTLNQADAFQAQLSAANAGVTTALVLLQAEQNAVHRTLEDAADGQPATLLLSDQGAAQNLAAQEEASLTGFARENLLSQHPAQENLLNTLGLGEAIQRQQGLVIGVIYTWQRARAAQLQVLQDSIAGQLQAAETLAHAQADPMDADALSALYSLIQFESHLALSVQNAAQMQATHDQQVDTLLVAFPALFVILVTGLLVIISLLRPLHWLWKGTQAASAGEAAVRVPVVGHDELADISSRVNDMLAAIESLLAELHRQQRGVVSAAERLCAEMGEEDESAVRAALAETGDPLTVLGAVCGEVIARFHGVVRSTSSAAQRLEQTAQRTRHQAEVVLLDYPGTPDEFVQGIMTTAHELEMLAREWSKALPGLREETTTEAEGHFLSKE